MDLIFGMNSPEASSYTLLQEQHGCYIAEAYLPHFRPGGAYLRLKAVPLIDDDGGIVGAVESIYDITDRRLAELALRESEERYRTLIELSPDPIIVHRNGIVLFVNQAGLMRIGASSPDQIIGQSTIRFVHPDSMEFVKERIRFMRKTGKPCPLAEMKLVRMDGTTAHVEVSSSPIPYQGEPAICAVVRDITERKLREVELAETADRLRTVIEASPVPIQVLNPNGNVLLWNPAAQRLFGWSEKEILGGPNPIVPVSKESEFHLHLSRVMSGEPMEGVEIQRVARDGSPIDLNLYTALLHGVDGEAIGVLAIMMDITERKKAEQTIQHLAYRDALTGLPNRTLFEDRLKLALAQAHRNHQQLAVMFLDVDRFQVINDTLGHAVGDRLLQAIAGRISACLGEGDSLARLGGDEFGLLLPSIEHSDDSARMAQRILDTLRAPFRQDHHPLYITASIGVSIYPHDGYDAQTLLRNADTALNRAKDLGRDHCQLYTAAMSTSVLKRLRMEGDLRAALRRNELSLHYQPQVDSVTGRVLGVEALVRWKHPVLGMIPPAEFIPLAEESGLVVPLGGWVLRAACAQHRLWSQAGLPPISISANLSARQLQPEFCAQLREILADTGMDPGNLELEITESMAMHQTERTMAVLDELRQIGVRVAMDDFGTGYSSLGCLKTLPIDTVKIDRSFVRDLTADSTDSAIAAAIISMAHNLGLRVIAEGVETEEQWRLLRDLTCDAMQGFLFSRPIPAKDLEQILAQGGSLQSKLGKWAA